MTTESDEGLNLIGALKERFGSLDRTEVRMKAERRAGMTSKQRARKGPPKVQINFRAPKETKDLLDALADHHGMSVTDVVVRAVEEFATRSKLGGRT